MRLVRGLPKSLPIRAVSGSVDFLKKLTPAVVRTAKNLAGQPCTEECSWNPMCVLFLYVHDEYEQQGRFRAMYVAIVENVPE